MLAKTIFFIKLFYRTIFFNLLTYNIYCGLISFTYLLNLIDFVAIIIIIVKLDYYFSFPFENLKRHQKFTRVLIFL